METKIEYDELKKIDFDECVELASISQNTHQYDNYNVKLYQTQDQKLIVKEDLCSDSNYFQVSKDEIINDNHDAYLQNWARGWAANGEEDERIQLIAWRLENPKIYEIDKDYDDKVKILYIGYYYGYQPIGYLNDDNYCDLIFDTYQDAQDYIDELEKDTYYLSHGEAGRPSYYIVEA